MANRAVSDGTTINDLILDEDDWPSHGEFVDHISKVTGQRRDNDVITSRERGQIVNTAAQSDIGNGQSPGSPPIPFADQRRLPVA